MDEMTLRFTTGDPRTDTLLRDIVTLYEGTFPEKIGGYYLFGSYADGSAVGSSDLDLIITFRGENLSADDARQAHDHAVAWSQRRGVRLDVLPLGEGQLRREGHYRVKYGSVLLYGDDIRAALPDLSLADYLRSYTRAPFGYAAEGFRHTDRLTFPLTYPEPDDEFFGYVLDNREPVKALVSAACWDASLLVTLTTGRMVASKGESVRLYRELVGGSWADFVATLYAQGKQRWSYAVPAATEDRRLLRQLCRDYLGLENHYFAHYRRYLLAELADDDPARVLDAARRLGTMLYPEPEISAALAAVVTTTDRETREAAREALTRIQTVPLDR